MEVQINISIVKTIIIILDFNNNIILQKIFKKIKRYNYQKHNILLLTFDNNKLIKNNILLDKIIYSKNNLINLYDKLLDIIIYLKINKYDIFKIYYITDNISIFNNIFIKNILNDEYNLLNYNLIISYIYINYNNYNIYIYDIFNNISSIKLINIKYKYNNLIILFKKIFYKNLNYFNNLQFNNYNNLKLYPFDIKKKNEIIISNDLFYNIKKPFDKINNIIYINSIINYFKILILLDINKFNKKIYYFIKNIIPCYNKYNIIFNLSKNKIINNKSSKCYYTNWKYIELFKFRLSFFDNKYNILHIIENDNIYIETKLSKYINIFIEIISIYYTIKNNNLYISIFIYDKESNNIYKFINFKYKNEIIFIKLENNIFKNNKINFRIILYNNKVILNKVDFNIIKNT